MDGMRSPAERLIVALDHPEPAAARRCVERLDGLVTRFKVGSVLFTSAGPDVVRELTDRGADVFLDLKFHDTPATVAGAVAAAARLGAGLLTLHAAGGADMVTAAREAAARARSRPRLLGVTVLTSLGPAAWREVAGPGGRSLAEAVEALGAAAVEAGADGLVCSAREVAALRHSLGPEPLLVVPGIRPAWSTSDHAGQARTATPATALVAGASAIVVGRAITEADDPPDAATRVLDEIAGAGAAA